MSDYEDSFLKDDDVDGGMFAHLAPLEEEKPLKKKINFTWIAKPTEEKNVKKPKGKQKKAKLAESTRERSRSRDRTVKKEEGKGNIIVISDDDEENFYTQNKYARLQQSLMEEHGYGSYDLMNHRERRKLDRLFERELRYFREGKPRDRLSNCIFNTIEEYFR